MKRRQKALNRLQQVLAEHHQNIESEAKRLEELELRDKKLDRGYYYTSDEPLLFVSASIQFKIKFF